MRALPPPSPFLSIQREGEGERMRTFNREAAHVTLIFYLLNLRFEGYIHTGRLTFRYLFQIIELSTAGTNNENCVGLHTVGNEFD